MCLQDQFARLFQTFLSLVIAVQPSYFSQVLYSKPCLTLVGFVAGQNKFMSYEYNSIFMMQASQKNGAELSYSRIG